MPLISAALAGSLAASTVINIAEIPVRSVNVCAESAEIVRQGEFSLAGAEPVLRLRGTPDMENVEFAFKGTKPVPATVESVGPMDYKIKVGVHEDTRLVGELRYRTTGVNVATLTKVRLEDTKNTAEVQTLAVISQTTGTTWKKVPFSYRSTCSSEGTGKESGNARAVSAAKLPPILGYGRASHPVIDAFRQSSLDVSGTGEPITVVLEQQTVGVEWRQRTDPSAGTVPFRYVVLPADRKYGERMIVHDGNKRTFETSGRIKDGKLEVPLGWVE